MEDKEVYMAQKMLNDYSEQQSTNVSELKKLDKKVKVPANIFAYIFGVFGALVLGTGMSLAMKVIGGTTAWMVGGIVIGVVGIVLCSINYFVYKAILSSRKKKYASYILALSNKILNK